MPALVVDGQAICGDQFGGMLISFEGWQFRVEILDRTDEFYLGTRTPPRGS